MPKTRNIVILHGWGASGRKFKPLASKLFKKGWNTLVLDLPGFSGQPPPPEEWGAGEYASWVYQKAKEKFGDQGFFVFGHSFGGRITIKLAAEGKKGIEGIILCSTAGLSRGNPLKRWVFLILAKVGKLLLLPGMKGLAAPFRRLLYKAAREHDYEKTKGVMREVFKKVIAEDLRPLLPRIKAPTLIVWGKKDRMTPVSAAYLARKKIKKTKLLIFPRAGHRLPYERPEELASEITKWSKSLT